MDFFFTAKYGVRNLIHFQQMVCLLSYQMIPIPMDEFVLSQHSLAQALKVSSK